jgi:hypothetical protein
MLIISIISCDNVNKNLTEKGVSYQIIQRLDDLDSTYHNDTVNIEGYLRKYENPYTGKGGGAQWFSYEVLLADSTAMPIKKNVIIDKAYNKKHIILTGIISKDPIHDKPCPPYCQNTTKFWQIGSIIDINLNEGTLPNKK